MRSAKLSDTSLKYLAALYDSRSATEAPSVPKSTQLSLKQKVFVRGSFNTGTTGYGFVAVAPSRLLGSDISCVTTSTSSSAMTPGTTLGSVTNLSNGSRSNSNFLSAAFGAGPAYISWKLISCTLHVKYAGTRLNKGGDMLLLEDPDHNDVLGYSYNSAMGLDMVKRVEVSDEWQHVCYTPSFENETDFYAGSITSASQQNSNSTMGVIVNSAGSSQPFDFEAYCWFEAVGSNVRGATQSYQDPIGWAAIDGAVNQFQQLDSVVGTDGLIRAVETQFNNFSGVSRTAGPQENFLGLASFLPALTKLADKAMPVLKGATEGALRGMGLQYMNSGQSAKTKTGTQTAKPPKIPVVQKPKKK